MMIRMFREAKINCIPRLDIFLSEIIDKKHIVKYSIGYVTTWDKMSYFFGANKLKKL